MKKLIIILSILCISSANVSASFYAFPDEKKPGDDKKAKAKREDTTKFVVDPVAIGAEEGDESADTTQFFFPSHDLYTSWDTDVAHPYKFNEAFKEDSVVIELTGPTDNCFVMPFRGPLTSLFGWRKYRPHYGTDINLETGDTVVSSFDGMVRVAKPFHGYGNCVIVRHKNGLETVYAHLSKILVQSGDVVAAGSILGLGGNTGRSYGSHLHFEIRYLGQALDTQDFIDYEKGDLKSSTFTLRKADVENKYDLRALHTRYKSDMGMVRGKNGKYYIPKGTTYRVKNGDTLGAIARKSKTTIKSLCIKNHIRPTTTLRIGQRLKI
ncbi:MAG: peptidoglycan DD-metalloendopeptidase family protein [bacterium]|nr:peptidoglycan DD-metalloendopeptidase family protein [bacterium]